MTVQLPSPGALLLRRPRRRARRALHPDRLARRRRRSAGRL